MWLLFWIYKISVFIHLLSAIFWIGGMLFTVMVLVPTMRHRAFSSQKGRFFAVMGKRFSKISWLLFAVLLLTGLTQLWARGLYFDKLWDVEFWESHFGTILAYKLILFSIVLIISGAHDFWLGPKAAYLIHKKPESLRTRKYRKFTGWVGRINLLLGLIILFLAISLVRG